MPAAGATQALRLAAKRWAQGKETDSISYLWKKILKLTDYDFIKYF